MQASGWIQFAIYFIALVLITKPMGLYLMRVLDASSRTWLDPILRPLERATYRLMGVDPNQEHDWKQYTLAMLLFSLVGCLFTYAILRLQHLLPLNPQGLGPLSRHLAFNTAVSFTTNTNWQSYVGESTMSFFSQMVGLTFHNFVSAATGIAIAAAFVRAIARHSVKTIGNFWVDLVRVTYYLLIPICLVFAVFLVSQGMIQNFNPYTKAKLAEPMKISVDKKNDQGETLKDADGKAITEEQTVEEQNIVQGPMASQVAIKMLGTNGGGYVNANAAHPFENPTPLSNLVQMLSIFSIGSGLTYYLGRMVKNQKHGWTVWAAMALLFAGGVLLAWHAEDAGNPIHQQLGVATMDGNMEGKEVRFGIFNSALFATITTDASCGAVNSMHDSFTALGGFVPLFNIQLGEVIFGGVGAGLYGMLVFVVLAVFIAGSDGRSHSGISRQKNRSVRRKNGDALVAHFALSILGFAAWAAVSKWGLAGLNNSGPHGLSEILYAFSSGAGNNGSAFAGLSANTALQHHFRPRHVVRAIPHDRPDHGASRFARRKRGSPPSVGTFPVSGGTFLILLLGTMLLIGALNFLPALTLGPIVEHLLTARRNLF